MPLPKVPIYLNHLGVLVFRPSNTCTCISVKIRNNMGPCTEPNNTRNMVWTNTIKNNFFCSPHSQRSTGEYLFGYHNNPVYRSVGHLIESLGKVHNNEVFLFVTPIMGLHLGFPVNHEWTGPVGSCMTYHFWSHAEPQLKSYDLKIVAWLSFKWMHSRDLQQI